MMERTGRGERIIEFEEKNQDDDLEG